MHDGFSSYAIEDFSLLRDPRLQDSRASAGVFKRPPRPHTDRTSRKGGHAGSSRGQINCIPCILLIGRPHTNVYQAVQPTIKSMHVIAVPRRSSIQRPPTRSQWRCLTSKVSTFSIPAWFELTESYFRELVRSVKASTFQRSTPRRTASAAFPTPTNMCSSNVWLSQCFVRSLSLGL